jgi:hypothetical protein
MSGFTVFWVILVIALLIVDYCVAREFQEVAEEKGYRTSKKYLWISFFFPWMGYLLVIALPDRNPVPTIVTEKKAEKASSDELPDL